MHIPVLLGVLLGLTMARLNLYEDSQISSPATSSSSSIEHTSGSYSVQITDQVATVSHGSFPGSATIASSSQAQIVSGSIQSTDVLTRTRLTTVTQTSFVPVSTLVTQSGSVVYYSTWLSVSYPTVVVTSTEYITGNTLTVTETSIETISLEVTPAMTYECICPPIMETVYVLATIGPIMAITSAILVPLDSTVVTSIPIAAVTSATFSPTITTSPSITLSIVSSSNENESIQSSTPMPNTIQTTSILYGNSTLTGNSTGLIKSPMVSQMPNGQLVIPLIG